MRRLVERRGPRAGTSLLAAAVTVVGILASPPIALADTPHHDRDLAPGAPGAPPPPAPIFVPSTGINRVPIGGDALAPWVAGVLRAVPTTLPSNPLLPSAPVTPSTPVAPSTTQAVPSTTQTVPTTGGPSRMAKPAGESGSLIEAFPSSEASGLGQSRPAQASGGPAKVPAPGLGTQSFYPLERRPLGDRMELLVNLSTGNVVVRDKDLAFPGTGLNTAVNHFYNNLASGGGAFGKRWTMSTGADIGLDTSDPNTIKLQGPSGYWQNYTSNGSGGYSSPPGANAKLAKTGSGWTLTFDKTKEKWNFNANGYFTTQVDANNNTITYRYNADNTLASITDTRGAVTTFEYDSAGRVVRMKDPTGFVYGDYTYDAQGQHTGFTDVSGKRVSYGYDANGNLTSITDPNGNVYKLSYDGQRRVTRIEEPREAGVTPATAVSTYDYSTSSQTKETAPTGGVTTYSFDSQGRQIRAIDPLGRAQSKTWTANSDVNATTSVGGNVSTASYDPNNNLTGTQLPTGAKNTVGYSDATNPTAPTTATDPEGRQTTMTYDAKGNPLTVKQAQTGQGLTHTYNANGTVQDSTDGRGSKTAYTYDGQGRLITVTPPAPRRAIQYTYDSRSRITSVIDGNGVRLDYAYDAADRVVQLSQGGNTIQQTDFDANGNKTANYFDGLTIAFTYSPRNQVLSGTRRGGVIVATDSTTYTYDANNNVTSLRDAGGTTSYRYNTANDVTDMTDIVGGLTRFTYDSDGNRSNTAYPNGASEAHEYDKSGREIKITNVAKNVAASVRTYSYAGANNADTGLVQAMGEPNNSTTRYSYDGSARLLRARNTANANGAVITDYGHAYDQSGNLTNFQGKAQTFNAANELTGIDGTAAGADSQGNFTSASGTTVSYTPGNQQDEKTTPDLNFSSYYDSTDNSQIYAIDDQVPATGNQYSYEFTQSALGMTGRVRDGQGRYSISRAPDGTPVMQRNPDGSTHYFELDRQGSIMGSTRSDGTRGAAFHYKPYGDFDYVSGADSSNGDNFLGFQGGFYHGAPRNSAFGYRWYSATIGQWTQPDPIGTPGAAGTGQDNRSGIGGPYSGDGNAYTFAGASPCNNTDPSGLFELPIDNPYAGPGGKCNLAGTAVGVGLTVVGLATGAGAFTAGIGIGVGIAIAGACKKKLRTGT